MNLQIILVQVLTLGLALAANPPSRLLPPAQPASSPVASATNTQAAYGERYGSADGGYYDSYGTYRPSGNSYVIPGGTFKSAIHHTFSKAKIILKKPVAAAPYVNAYRPPAVTYGAYKPPTSYSNGYGYGNSLGGYGYANVAGSLSYGYGKGKGYAAGYGGNYGTGYNGYGTSYSSYGNGYGYGSGYKGYGTGYGTSYNGYGTGYGSGAYNRPTYGSTYGYSSGYGSGYRYGSGYGGSRYPVTFNGFDHYNGPFYYGGWQPTLGPYGNALTPNNLNAYYGFGSASTY